MTQPEDPTRPYDDPMGSPAADAATSPDNSGAGETMASEQASSADTDLGASSIEGSPDAPAAAAADVPEPPARMPGAYAPYVPLAPEPVAPEPPAAEPEMVSAPLPEMTGAPETPAPPAPVAPFSPPPEMIAAPMAPLAPTPAVPVPDPAPPVAPASMSGPASTDTQEWELPPASAIAGAAAASQWAQPAPAVPQPIVPPPIAPQPVTPPPPAQTWQPAQTVPPPAPAQQWQQPQPTQPQQPPAQQWQAAPPPPQQTWQQPQPQQPWTQQPQQYQQPYGQPYGQPYAQPYGQAYAAQQLPYSTSPLAVFAGLLLLVFGIGIIALGLFTLTQGQELSRFIRDNDIAVFGIALSHDMLRTVLTPSPAILIVLGTLQLMCGIGVMAHKGWGRWIGFLLALFGLILSVFAVSIAYALAGGFTLPVIIGVVLLVGYVLIVLALLAGGSHFRRRTAPR